jgi:uncharacterized membrane protein
VIKQSINSIKNVRRAKKLLEKIAYASLIIDILISLTTLISLNIGNFQAVTNEIQLLSYALTVIVIVSLALLGEILLLSHYHKILEAFLLINGKLSKSVRKLYSSGDEKNKRHY